MKSRTAQPEETQDEPTQPRPRDAAGRELDGHGLPRSGPARLRALAGRPDPALAETASEGAAPPAETQKED